VISTVSAPLNKSMDRDDLLTPQGMQFTGHLSRLTRELDEKHLPVTSWYGGLNRPRFEFSLAGMRLYARRLLGRTRRVGTTAAISRGGDAYQSLPGVSCDDMHPWFLYWEAFWVTANGPDLTAQSRVLDAGGTASLFSYFLASRGAETHSVDLNPRLVAAGNETAGAMNWNLRSHCMDMAALQFDSASFDHAYSICVFEHLDADLRQRALREIARVLKPGGILSLTFDYGAPGVHLAGTGPNYEPQNLIRTPDDVRRHFCACGAFEPVGNADFFDNGKRYLNWPDDPARQYTFGAIFLRRVR
jgi:SAM-dependent methyltransferase